MDTAGDGRGRMNWESSIDLYISFVNNGNWQRLLYDMGASPGICDGGRVGREAQGGGDVYIFRGLLWVAQVVASVCSEGAWV